MSFTVMRYKDGKPVPIKMSIWDAFKGAPPVKPKPKLVSSTPSVVEPMSVSVDVPNVSIDSSYVIVKCPCCHKIHSESKSSELSTISREEEKSSDENPVESKPEAHSETVANDIEAKKNEKKADKKGQDQTSKEEGGDKKQAGSRSTKDQETYSKADDKKIIELKGQEKSWKEILEAIGKQSKSQLQDHWKAINPQNKDGQSNGPNDAGSKGDAKKDNEGTAKADGGKKKGGGQGKQNDKQHDTKAKGGKDNTATKADASTLKGWSDRYDKQKWIAAASRHFDLTGQRITAATAKKLAEGK